MQYRAEQLIKMLKCKLRNQYTHLPAPPPSPSWCVHEAGLIADHLVRKQHAKKFHPLSVVDFEVAQEPKKLME
jgi:hypothetical protein